MIKSLFGPTSITSALRRGLDETMATHGAIADRVANAHPASSATGFKEAMEASEGKAAAPDQRSEVDLQADMAALADTTIRYEAEARLLQGAYSGLRAAIRSNG